MYCFPSYCPPRFSHRLSPINRYNRLDKVKDLWWESGTVISEDMKENLSSHEVEFFESYDKLLGSYMDEIDINLAADQNPPKQLFVEVRALQDYGEVLTDTGVVNLKKNTVHFLRRSDAELLIRQGVLEQTS